MFVGFEFCRCRIRLRWSLTSKVIGHQSHFLLVSPSLVMVPSPDPAKSVQAPSGKSTLLQNLLELTGKQSLPKLISWRNVSRAASLLSHMHQCNARTDVVLHTHWTIRLMSSRNPCLGVQPVFRSIVVQIVSCPPKPSKCTQAQPTCKSVCFSVSTSFELQDSSMSTCLQVHVCCICADFQVLFHRDRVSAVFGSAFPGGSGCVHMLTAMDCILFLLSSSLST